MRINPLGINNRKVHYENCTRIRPSWPRSRLRLNLLLAFHSTCIPCCHASFSIIQYLAVCPKWIGFHTSPFHCYLGGFLFFMHPYCSKRVFPLIRELLYKEKGKIGLKNNPEPGPEPKLAGSVRAPDPEK